jgi:hypothetical protein
VTESSSILAAITTAFTFAGGALLLLGNDAGAPLFLAAVAVFGYGLLRGEFE